MSTSLSTRTSTKAVRRPRAFGIAATTAFLVAILFGVMNWLAYDVVGSTGSSGNAFVDQTVLRHLNPFAGYLFGPDFTSDNYVPWLVGALVAVLVVFVLVGVFCRAGVVAAFLGGWVATSLGATAGVLASIYVQVKSDNGDLLSDKLAVAFSYGAHWGLLFGGAVGLLAAFWTSVLRKRVGSDYDETPAEERTTSAYADLPD